MTEKRVLIVEDDAILAYNLQRVLTEMGYGVPPPAASGREAIEQARQIIPDLILMDVRLKGDMDGIETAALIQAQMDIPIVFLSAYSSETLIKEMQRVSPYGYLVKPVAEKALYAALETAYFKHLADKKIRDSEERYRAIMTQTLACIFLISERTKRILECNPAFLAKLGYTAEETSRLSILDVLDVDHHQVENFFHSCHEAGSFHFGETRMVAKNGQRIDVEISCSIIRFKDENVISLMAHDISEHKRMEQALRSSEQRFRILFENMQDGVLVTQYGIIHQANKSMATMLGFEGPEELIGRNVLDFLPTESRASTADHIRRLRQTRSLSGLISRTFIRRDGSPVFVEISAGTIEINHELFGLGVMRDVSERIQLEKEIHQSKREWELTFDAVKDMVIITDLEGNIRRCNRSVVDTLNLPFQNVIGRKLSDFFIYNQISGTTKQFPEGEVQFANLPGWYEVSSFPLQVDEKMHASVYLIRDVTLRKGMIDHFMETSKTLSLGTLTAGIAHEMNTPLQIITGSADILLDRIKNGVGVEDKVAQTLERISDNAWRIAEIVHALLLFTRSATDQMELCNINQVIQETITYLRPKLIEKSHISVLTNLDEQLPAMLCDPGQITQVLIHLISNAQEAMPAGGLITIRSSHDSDNLYLEIGDTGFGIPEGIRDKIFDPFFTTKQFGDGMGLGLSVVMGIVKAHKGEITFTSREREGTTFRIELPRFTKTSSDEPDPVSGRFSNFP